MTTTATQRDEFMPSWAEWDLGWEDVFAGEGMSRVVGVTRGSFSLNMAQTIIDGTPRITDYTVDSSASSWFVDESGVAGLADEIRSEASALYELADIITGIAKQQPKADMRTATWELRHGLTEHTVVTNIRRLIKQSGLGQNEFAVSINYSPTEFSQLMAGRMRWDLNDVERAAHGLGVLVSDLIEEVAE